MREGEAEPAGVHPDPAARASTRREVVVSALAGVFAGLFGGIAGVGGSVILIAVLVGALGMEQRRAHGTSALVLVFTGLAGAAGYARHGAVDVRAALILTVPAMLTAPLGTRLAHALPEWRLRRSFGAFLLLVSGMLLARGQLSALTPWSGWQAGAVLAAAGALSGVLTGMLGSGGGSLMVPALVLLLGTDQHVAQGTSLLAMIPTGLAAGMSHLRRGSVAVRLLPGLVPGTVVGSYAGSALAGTLPDAGLRLIFTAILVAMGVRYLRSRPRGGASAT